jgi:lipopolysaccharide/colanic/teichoic acid biosynthesis glycosyltransferase
MDFVLETAPLSPAVSVAGQPLDVAAAGSGTATVGPTTLHGARKDDDRLIRALDVTIAVVLLIFFLPLMLSIALLLAPAGRILFAQRRIGRDGAEFHCLKFRSMVVDAEARLTHLLETSPEARREWANTQKLKDDPRITPLGRFLRKTSLDELPQLLNILSGDMSIVGPRPIVRAEIGRYGRYFPRYCAVKPGLTGLWQISGRSDVDYRRRVALDMLYVKSKSVKIYLLVIMKTPLMVIGGRGSY